MPRPTDCFAVGPFGCIDKLFYGFRTIEPFFWKSRTCCIVFCRDHGYDGFNRWQIQLVQGRAANRDLPDHRDSVLLCAGEFVTGEHGQTKSWAICATFNQRTQ